MARISSEWVELRWASLRARAWGAADGSSSTSSNLSGASCLLQLPVAPVCFLSSTSPAVTYRPGLRELLTLPLNSRDLSQRELDLWWGRLGPARGMALPGGPAGFPQRQAVGILPSPCLWTAWVQGLSWRELASILSFLFLFGLLLDFLN